eukprot:1145946-Pelagomonas_calceolata.AAC.3
MGLTPPSCQERETPEKSPSCVEYDAMRGLHECRFRHLELELGWGTVLETHSSAKQTNEYTGPVMLEGAGAKLQR